MTTLEETLSIDGAATRAPIAMLAMKPGLERRFFGGGLFERLTAGVQLVFPNAVDSFSDVPDGELARVEVLVMSWGAPQLSPEQLERMPDLRAVIHAAGSVKYLLAPEVWERGVVVSSAALANARPVAEFSLAMILLAGKDAFWVAREYAARAGSAIDLVDEYPAIGNAGRTVGVVGASRIGRLLIDLLTPFDIDVLLFDPFIDADEARGLGVELVELDELMTRSSIVSLHAPSVPATRHMIGRAQLALLADGATLINTARAQLVDQDALVAQLSTGRIRAILDVTEPEVLPAEHVLRSMPNVYITPHLAGAQGNELLRLGLSAVEELERFLAGVPLVHPVLIEDREHTA